MSWHVKPGDTVTINQVLVEIETAKAVVDIKLMIAEKANIKLIPFVQLEQRFVAPEYGLEFGRV